MTTKRAMPQRGQTIFEFVICIYKNGDAFSFKYRSPFFLRMVLTYFHSSIAHLEQFVKDGEFSWTVNSCGHFLMVITNGATAVGEVCKAPARFSEHCTVSGQGVRGRSPF